jgi:hypothetical protein
MDRTRAQRAVREGGAGKKVILPIWHGITREDLIEYSPAFADRLAKNSITNSHADIVRSLLSMLGRPVSTTAPVHAVSSNSAVAMESRPDANGQQGFIDIESDPAID